MTYTSVTGTVSGATEMADIPLALSCTRVCVHTHTYTRKMREKTAIP